MSKTAAQRVLSAVVLIASIALTGCGHSEHSSKQPPPEKKKDTLTIGVSLSSLNGPWRAQMKEDIEAAAKAANVELIIMDAKDDGARQLSQLEELRAMPLDAIIISPKNTDPITSPVARIFDAGIPVIVLDRSLLGGKYTCFIAADPTQIGTEAGKWLAAKLNGKGKIIELLAPVDSASADQLRTAFRAELRDPGYRFTFTGHVDPPNIDAEKLMTEALEKTKEIDAVFAYDDATAYKAYQVAKAAKREKGVIFIGIGGMKTEGAEYVKQGAIDASFLFPVGGADAVEAALQAIHGQKLSKKIVPKTKVITKESIPK